MTDDEYIYCQMKEKNVKERIIKDCVHNFITVPNRIAPFIDVPEFQRLRRVKQLGNVSRVFPSATHMRFEHSLGVMHLAGKLCDVLKVDKRIKELIQLAGLFHDVGHGPYSHLYDHILYIVRPSHMLNDHEDRSVKIFLDVSKRLNILDNKEEEFVCACITGFHLIGYDPYLFQIISSPVDVDRLDYLCRDSLHTGLPSFQYEYIILNATITHNKTLGFRRKAYEDIKDMFQTRERLHKLVYQTKVSLEYDTLYKCMISKLKDELDFNELLDDYELDTILRKHEKTKDMYYKMECRNKSHRHLCDDKNHIEECTRIIPEPGNINDIIWTD